MQDREKKTKAVGNTYPTLEDIIKKCGVTFHALYYQPFEKYPWLAVSRPQKDTEEYSGFSPKEAVEKLFNAIEKDTL